MFAPCLRAARDRALDHVLRRLLPSGSVGHDDPVATHRLPWVLASTGHQAAARRVLDHIARRHVMPSGDVRLSEARRSHDADCDASPTRMPAFVALGALATRHFALSRRLTAYLDTFRVPALPQGASTSAGSDGATDLASTLHVGMVHLALGRDADALAAAAWIAALTEAQPHPEAFLLRRDTAGALVTLWSADPSSAHAVHAGAQGHGQGLLGDTLAFLTDVAALSQEPLTATLHQASEHVVRFVRRMLSHVQHPCDLASLARGVALHARALHDRGDRAALDARDLAVSLALRAAVQGQPDGSFGRPDAPEATRYDETAWVCGCLHETLAALDEVEPVSYPQTPTTGWRVVLCNVPEGKAQEIADALVTERLAACVNALGPVRSTYVWKGALERDTEVTLLLKTTAERVAALTARLVALHPYELPEVIALPLAPDEGHAPYLDWVRAQVAPDGPSNATPA